VQYLKFDTGGAVPATIECDFPALAGEVRLADDVRAALAEDLARA
jgi:hypothetical protein